MSYLFIHYYYLNWSYELSEVQALNVGHGNTPEDWVLHLMCVSVR